MEALTIGMIEDALHEFEYSVNWQTFRYGFGYHLARRIGGGFRYEGVKSFEAYPNPRRINWKQTDKLGLADPLVNVFREEHEIDIVFIADLSRSMDFGAPVTKRARLAKVAALVAYAVRKSRDRFGFVGVTDEIEESVTRPLGLLSRQDPLAIAQDVLAFQARSKGLGAFGEAAAFLPRTTSLVFVASDFLPSAEWRELFFETIARIAERHDIVPLVIRASEEREIPPEGLAVLVEDSETGERALVRLDAAARREFAAFRDEEARMLSGFFQDHSIEPIWLWPETDIVDTLIDYFTAR